MNYKFVKLSRKQLRIIVCMEVLFQCQFVILAVDYRTITFYRSYQSTVSMYIPKLFLNWIMKQCNNIFHMELRFAYEFVMLELD